LPPLVFVTGFGPFEDVARNPSREVALSLERAPPPGVRVRAVELPVTFEGAPRAVAAAIRSLAPERPDVLLGLGAQKKDYFRLERRARGRLAGDRLDNAGRSAGELGIDGGPDLETDLDLEVLAAALRAAGAERVRVSEEAGGYVCERTYHALLASASEIGAPALFLHLPPTAIVAIEAQVRIVSALAGALAAQVSSSMRGRSSAERGSEAAKARKART
jgi:pyroglutamyl-peptidase